MQNLFDFIWVFIRPDHLLILLLVTGLLLRVWRVKLGNTLVISSSGMLLMLMVFPMGVWLMQPLEEQYPQPAELPESIDGIIVLGGAEYLTSSYDRQQPQLNNYSERLTTFIWLAREYPEATLVYSGGSRSRQDENFRSAEVARMLFQQIDPAQEKRIIYERESQNTYENALYSVEKLHQLQLEKGRWLLVTSAAHMPRAMGSFKAQGVEPIPWPVDFRTVPAGWWSPTLHHNLNDLYDAVHEWLGLLGYRLLGRI